MTQAPDGATEERAAVEGRARLRRADAWTGLVLGLVSLLMVLEALTYPLQGTYAGVRNAWYVSPALFPLIVGGVLFVLSGGLIAVALRDYARLRRGRPLFALVPGSGGAAREAWFIAILLTAYVVGLVPRVDFLVGAALFLFVFMAGYSLEARSAARPAVAACLVVPAMLALVAALAGAWPAPRSGGQFAADAAVALVFPLAFAIAMRLARAAERRRLKVAALTSLLTAFILAALFRHGLLVPLPREGLGALLMEKAAGALSRLGG